jgi:hypothetical protein
MKSLVSLRGENRRYSLVDFLSEQKNATNFTHLEISEFWTTSEDIIDLHKFIARNQGILVSMHVNSIRLPSIQDFFEEICHIDTLLELRLDGMRVSGDVRSSTFQRDRLILLPPALKLLQLTHTGIHGGQLSPMLQTSLVSMNLSFNNIGDRGATSIAEVLLQNTTLTVLILADTRIGKSGCQSLLQSSSLVQLDLSENQLEWGDVTAAINKCTSLKKLRLTEMRTEGFDFDLLQALEKNKNLKYLSLSIDDMYTDSIGPYMITSPPTTAALLRIFEFNKTLSTFNLGGMVDWSTRVEISKILSKTPRYNPWNSDVLLDDDNCGKWRDMMLVFFMGTHISNKNSMLFSLDHTVMAIIVESFFNQNVYSAVICWT